MTHSQAGRIGAMRKARLYPREHYVQLGRKFGHLGGRPRATTIADVPAPQFKLSFEGRELPASLTELRGALRELRKAEEVQQQILEGRFPWETAKVR